jgi:glucokinase
MADNAGPRRAEGVVVGIDIGGTKTALLATDVATGHDLATDRFATPAEAGPDAMLDRLAEAIATLLSTAGRQPEELAAVGVAVPGLVDSRNGRVKVAGNLKGWTDLPCGISWTAASASPSTSTRTPTSRRSAKSGAAALGR